MPWRPLRRCFLARTDDRPAGNDQHDGKINSSRCCRSSPPPIHEQGRSAKRDKCDWHERRPKKIRVMLIKLLPDECTKTDEADQNGRRKQHQSRAVAKPSGCETD